MKRKPTIHRTRFLSVAAATIALAVTLPAAPAQTPLPGAFLYQGQLSDAGLPAAGSHEFEFALYGAESGGTPLATVNKAGIPVTGGVFHADLDFGAAAFNGQARWLEIRVRRTDGGPALTTLSPRQALLPAPHALFAARAGSVPDGSITQNKIAPGHVANTALAEQAVTGNKIADGTIEGYKLATGTVTGTQLADGSVTAPKLAPLAVATGALADLSVTTPKLADASVTAAKLAPGAIGPQQLSKSYRAGMVSLSGLPNDFVPRIAATFIPAMTGAPVVVTGFRSLDYGDAAGALMQQTDATASGFSARVMLPATFSHAGYNDADATLWGDGLAVNEVNGEPATVYALDSLAAHGVEYNGRSTTGANTYAELDNDFRPRECALAVMNGIPMAVWLGEDTPGNAATQRLRFGQATSADGGTWNLVSNFANASAAGWSGISLQNVGGRPAISYLDAAGAARTVRYRRAGLDLGTWPAAVSVFSDPGITAVSKMIFVNNFPAIAWVQSGRVRYARAADITGSAWQAPVYLSGPGADGAVVLGVIDGTPAAAFHHSTNVLYTRALDAEGTSWPAGGNVVSYTAFESLSLAADGAGRPCVCGTSPGSYSERDIIILTSEADDKPWTPWMLESRADDATAPVVLARTAVSGLMTQVCYYYSSDPDGRRRLRSVRPGAVSGSASWIAVEP